MKRTISLVLTLLLVFTLIPSGAFAASQTYGPEVWLKDTELQQGAVLSDNIYWSDQKSQPRHERFVTYTPHMAVAPKVTYGATVCDRISVGTAAKNMEAQGHRVVAAINGDFYDTATGAPLGIMVTGGQILSGSGEYYALGFRPDGSAIMGKPGLRVTMTRGGSAIQPPYPGAYPGGFPGGFPDGSIFPPVSPESLSLSGINKPRADGGGAVLITYDFRNDHTTGTKTPGLTVLANIESGSASIGGSMTLRVTSTVTGTDPVPLSPGQVALTVADTSPTNAKTILSSLMPGESLTVSFTADDPNWNGVQEAIGALHLLVDNGVAQTGFQAGYAPRTAVGLKANGEVILYTMDGRQTDKSMGVSLNGLAQRMVELGCVTAICLDGGGSTTLVGATPDAQSSKLLNFPSDKNQRRVANHLLLLAPGTPTGQPAHAYVSSDAPAVLAGQTMKITAGLADSSYFPVNAPVELQASAGTIVDGVFHAPMQGGPVTITASAPGVQPATLDVLVVTEPHEVSIRRNGNALSKLTLTPGQEVELSVAATYNHMPLAIAQETLQWTVDPSLGAFTGSKLKANYTMGSGTISVTLGTRTVTLPLTLDSKSPFVDTVGHWAESYMAILYHQGVLSGVTVDGKLYAKPDSSVTREEFAVLMSRYLGLKLSDYTGTQVPYADMDKVQPWAQDAVRAMYTMGIITGTDTPDKGVIFDPQGILTRAQAMTILLRIRSGGPIAADLSGFSDADKIPPYAREAFETMVSLGVVGGNGGRLEPNGAMTRAAICKVLATLPQ